LTYDVWVIVVVLTVPAPADGPLSVAWTVQNPGLPAAVYVTVATPLEFVAAVAALSVPQLAVVTTKATFSPLTAAPLTSVSVTVTVEVPALLTETDAGLADSTIVFLT
jgi:hypothetical protein